MNNIKRMIGLILLVIGVIAFLAFVAPRIYPAELHGYVEVGLPLEKNWAVMETQLELHHHIWIFDNMIFGGWETWMVRNGILNSPFKDIYNTGYRIGYKKIYAQIEHYCNHPVYSKYNAEWWNENRRSGNSLSTISIGVRW